MDHDEMIFSATTKIYFCWNKTLLGWWTQTEVLSRRTKAVMSIVFPLFLLPVIAVTSMTSAMGLHPTGHMEPQGRDRKTDAKEPDSQSFYRNREGSPLSAYWKILRMRMRRGDENRFPNMKEVFLRQIVGLGRRNEWKADDENGGMNWKSHNLHWGGLGKRNDDGLGGWARMAQQLVQQLVSKIKSFVSQNQF